MSPSEPSETDILELRKLLTYPSFRRFIFRHLGYCGVYRTSVFEGEDNGSVMFREGARTVALRLLSEMEKADKNAYPKMLTEQRAAPEQKK